MDQWVIQHPHDPTPDQKRAIRDVVTIQCCKDVLKTFMIHVNPDEFFKAGGDPTKLSVLLGKECQKACGKRKLWNIFDTSKVNTYSTIYLTELGRFKKIL